MFNLDDCIGIITSRGAKALAQAFEKRLEAYNITRVQWIAIYYIGEIKGLTQRELADKISTTEPSVARLIDRMEKNELVIREKDANDRRISTLVLTQKGNELREKLIPIGEQFSTDITNAVGKEELEVFIQVMEKMINNIK